MGFYNEVGVITYLQTPIPQLHSHSLEISSIVISISKHLKQLHKVKTELNLASSLSFKISTETMTFCDVYANEI